MTTFFGFSVADSMFPDNCRIAKHAMDVEEVRATLVARKITSCCNPSHLATIDAMRSKFGIDVEIPETPPRVSLGIGDSVICMGVRGLARLTDRHEYTREEIEKASFVFSMYTVIG